MELEDERVKREAFKTLLPLYTLGAAAGHFGDGHAVEPEGWIEADNVGRLNERMFVCRAVGRSMEPTIRDGHYLVFRAKSTSTRQGKVVLAQYRGPADPDTGGTFTVKRYSSENEGSNEADWRHTKVTLFPHEPGVFADHSVQGEAESVQIVAEFVTVLKGDG